MALAHLMKTFTAGLGDDEERKQRLTEIHRQLIWKNAIRIQAAYRGFLYRQQICRTRVQAIARGWLCRMHRRVEMTEALTKIPPTSIEPSSIQNEVGGPATSNLIKIFQASPLAYVDANHEPRRVPRIDLHFERETISKALKDSCVTVEYEIATDDRFGAFLAKGQGHAIHFSCHGHSKFLAFEDGWGQVQYMESSVLKRWIACAQLQFVFVSACDSYAIGKAFVEAGVPHVVCCDTQTTVLDSGAAVKFTKALYQALAWGKTVKEAFELARQELKVYPCYESQQFCLLPEDAPHDIRIFSTKSRPRPDRPAEPDSLDLPSPTDFFVRDDLEMYRTIQAIKKSRLVRVTGQKGIGKSTLVKECCRYLADRQTIVNIDDIVWKSVDDKDETESYPGKWFCRLFYEWQQTTPSASVVKNYTKKIIKHYKEKRTLLVLEAKRLSKSSTKRMHTFLKNLIHHTNHLRSVVIYGRRSFSDNARPLPLAFDIHVVSLNIESTVKLFARYCEHVTNRSSPGVANWMDLWRTLVPKGPTNGSLSRRHRAILKILGGSNPKNVCRVASTISKDDYLTLLNLGTYEELDRVKTRAEVLFLEVELKRRIALRRKLEDTKGRMALDRKLKALNILKKQFPGAKKLKDTVEKHYAKILCFATLSRQKWFSYVSKIESLENLMNEEEDSLLSWLQESMVSQIFLEGIEVSFSEETKGPLNGIRVQVHPDVLESKRGVKSCLLLLKDERDDLASNNMFDKAETLDMYISLLEELCCLRESRSVMESRSAQLGEELSNFRSQRDWDRARVAIGIVDKLYAKLQKEANAAAQNLSISAQNDLLEISYCQDTEHSSPCAVNYTSLVDKQKKKVFNLLDRQLNRLRDLSKMTRDDSRSTLITEPSTVVSSVFTS